MKLIRSLIIIMCGIIIFLSSILFFGSMTSQYLFKEDLTKVVVTGFDIKSPIDEALSSIKIPKKIRNEIINKTDKLKEEIIKNKEFNTFVNKYSIAILDNVANDTSLYPNINADFKNVLDAHEQDLKDVVKGYMDESYVSIVLTSMKENINLEPVYKSAITSVKQQITPEQKIVVEAVDTLTQDSTKIISVAAFLIASIIVVLLMKSFIQWMIPVGIPIVLGGMTLFIGSRILPSLIPASLQTNNDIISGFISTECERMATYGLLYLTIGGILCVIFVLLQRVFPKKEISKD